MTVNPNQHERIRADLKAFADGELSPFARFFVARHLRGCPSCREELIQMQTLSTELRESDPEAAPLSSDLRAHILENAPTSDDIQEGEIIRPRRISPRKVIFAVGLSVVAAIILFPTFGKPRENARRGVAYDLPADPNSSSFNSSRGIGGPVAMSPIMPPAPPAPSAGAVGDDARRRAETESSRAASDFKSSNSPAALDQLKNTQGDEQQAVSSNGNGSTDFSVNLASPSGRNETFSAVPATRAVHREGSISVSVQNAEAAGDEATSIIKNAGGFVANTTLQTGNGQRRTAVLDCRVPVTQFETVAKKIGALGKVRAKALSGQDITAQVAQSGARRQTLSNELSIAQARLAKLENSRKPNSYDIYRLRAEVRTLRMQASQARAALETLQKYGSLSSLYVSLQDGDPTIATPQAAGWFDTLSPSTQAAWSAFASNARLPVQLIMWILAYSPLWIPALIIYRKYGRKWLTE
ncbi:DUF4349 domain-containing protein [bacterium]|nr:MAG: DUF4349 domain-containing protein [bacterium]